MHSPKTVIDEIIAQEKPIKIDPESVLVDNIGTTLSTHLRRMEKERKQAERDASIRENHKFCRKRCKLFKTRECFKKTFEEQTKCVNDRGYEKPIEESSPCETS